MTTEEIYASTSQVAEGAKSCSSLRALAEQVGCDAAAITGGADGDVDRNEQAADDEEDAVEGEECFPAGAFGGVAHRTVGKEQDRAGADQQDHDEQREHRDDRAGAHGLSGLLDDDWVDAIAEGVEASGQVGQGAHWTSPFVTFMNNFSRPARALRNSRTRWSRAMRCASRADASSSPPRMPAS